MVFDGSFVGYEYLEALGFAQNCSANSAFAPTKYDQVFQFLFVIGDS